MMKQLFFPLLNDGINALRKKVCLFVYTRNFVRKFKTRKSGKVHGAGQKYMQDHNIRCWNTPRCIVKAPATFRKAYCQ